MDTSSMTFEEILFNGRWHIIGALMFLVFLGSFMREVVRELMAERQKRRSLTRTVAVGPLFQGARLGHTMTDGGEPMADVQEDPAEPRD